MICITYIIFIFLGFVILLNNSKKLNNILIYISILIIAPLGFLSINKVIQINFFNYDLEIIKENHSSYYIITSFILAFIFGIINSMNLKPINYKETSIIFILTSCVLFASYTNNLKDSIIIIQIIVILYSIIIAINNPNNNKLLFLKILSVNILGTLLIFIGIDFYTNITSRNSIENLIFFQHFSKYFILMGLLILLGFPIFVNGLVEAISCVKTKNLLFLAIFLPIINLILLIKLFSGEPLLFYIGIFLTLYGILFSILTSNLRKIIAYSIIHNVGFIMMFISLTSTINWYIINNYLFTYIMCMISLFAILSFCEHFFHTNNILELKGVFYFKPIVGIVLLFIAFNSLSMPFTTNFILKNVILNTLHNNNNYIAYLLIFFSISASALHIGFRIPYFLYLSKPTFNYIDKYKTYKISNTTIYILLSILLISIIQISLLYLKSDINYLNNTLNGFKTGFIGIFLFIITYPVYQNNKKIILYQISNIIISYFYVSLLNIVTILRKIYSIFIDKIRIFITKILTRFLTITNLYYNSRIIVIMLILVIILVLTLTIL